MALRGRGSGRGRGGGGGKRRQPLPGKACHFEDGDGNCFELGSRGLCGAPQQGAAALVQHADERELCQSHPPFGFRPLCEGRDKTGGTPAANLRMLRNFRDPARCRYRSCAIVGAGGTLLGARLGHDIDAHEAVIRINLSPDGPMAAEGKSAPHRHVPTWVADVGARTSWRVVTMEVYGYLSHYSRFWLQQPKGHGKHANMSGVPQEPLLAVSCHTPTRSMGRCRAERLQQTFGHPWSSMVKVRPWYRHNGNISGCCWRQHLKAQGRPPHSGGDAQRLRTPQEATPLQAHAAQVAIFTAIDHAGGRRAT